MLLPPIGYALTIRIVCLQLFPYSYFFWSATDDYPYICRRYNVLLLFSSCCYCCYRFWFSLCSVPLRCGWFSLILLRLLIPLRMIPLRAALAFSVVYTLCCCRCSTCTLQSCCCCTFFIVAKSYVVVAFVVLAAVVVVVVVLLFKFSSLRGRCVYLWVCACVCVSHCLCVCVQALVFVFVCVWFPQHEFAAFG